MNKKMILNKRCQSGFSCQCQDFACSILLFGIVVMKNPSLMNTDDELVIPFVWERSCFLEIICGWGSGVGGWLMGRVEDYQTYLPNKLAHWQIRAVNPYQVQVWLARLPPNTLLSAQTASCVARLQEIYLSPEILYIPYKWSAPQSPLKKNWEKSRKISKQRPSKGTYPGWI